MPYVPLNVNVYAAAFAGATAGIGVPTGAFITDPIAADYATTVAVAAVYAQAVDTAWGAGIANAYDIQAITDGSTNIFARGPGHPLVGAVTTQVNWTIVAMALVALVREGDADAIAEGITLPPLSVPGAPFPAIANLAALALFDVGTGLTQLPAGAEVYLLSLRCPLRLIKYAAAPPALIPFQTFTVLAGGVIDPLQQWMRLDCESAPDANPWLPQLAWQIGPVGNDEALGTAAAPLATFVEFTRRMRGARLNAIYTVDIQVAQAGLVSDFELGPLGMVVIDGNNGATVAAAWPAGVQVAAIGGYTAPVPGGPQYAIVDVDTPPGFDWTPYVGLRVRCSPNAFPHAAGPLDRCTFIVASVNPAGGGNNTARVSIPNGFDAYDPLLPGLTGLVPQNGDFLLCEDLIITGGPVVIRVQKELGAVLPSVNIIGFTIQGPAVTPTSLQIVASIPGADTAPQFGLPIIFGCLLNITQIRHPIQVWESGFIGLAGPLQIGGYNSVTAMVYMQNCLFPLMQGQSSNCQFTSCLWQATLWNLMPGLNRFIGNNGFFDLVGATALTVPQAGAFVYSEDDLFGNGNDRGLNVTSPGFSWVFQGGGPNINAGGALEFRILGVEYTWALNLPYPVAATTEDVTIQPFTP